jgi:hypothetical protein
LSWLASRLLAWMVNFLLLIAEHLWCVGHTRSNPPKRVVWSPLVSNAGLCTICSWVTLLDALIAQYPPNGASFLIGDCFLSLELGGGNVK